MKKSVLLVIFSLFLMCVSSASAHTFHTSLTRMDYNQKEKLAEISIQLFTHDLVPALERYAKKKIDLEKTPDLDKIILQYLDANFILKDKTGAAKKLVWVGKQQEIDIIYVYAQIALDEEFADYSLQNTIFFDAFPKQANMVVARFGEKKADLLYKVGDKEKRISPKIEDNKTSE